VNNKLLADTTCNFANNKQLQLNTLTRSLTGLLTVQAQLLTTFSPSNIGISDWGGRRRIISICWDACTGWRMKSAKHTTFTINSH